MAKLVRLLQQDYGVALAGAVLISPGPRVRPSGPLGLRRPALGGHLPDHGGRSLFPRPGPGSEARGVPTGVRPQGRRVRGQGTPPRAGREATWSGKPAGYRTLDAAADFIGLPRDIVRAKGWPGLDRVLFQEPAPGPGPGPGTVRRQRHGQGSLSRPGRMVRSGSDPPRRGAQSSRPAVNSQLQGGRSGSRPTGIIPPPATR
ncbi:MAG: hypothetical protein M0C28_30220 [Candidatus Moduliflexus flocculans]|nr:hypothetical protein [Candidatus Moduliflexus flocculans]